MSYRLKSRFLATQRKIMKQEDDDKSWFKRTFPDIGTEKPKPVESRPSQLAQEAVKKYTEKSVPQRRKTIHISSELARKIPETGFTCPHENCGKKFPTKRSMGGHKASHTRAAKRAIRSKSMCQ